MAENWDTQGHSGAESFNDGCDTGNKAGGSSDTFAEGAGGQDEPGRIQEDKINKKKLAELEDDGKILQIFVRPSKKSGLVPYTAVKGIPLTVATICSNLLFEKITRKGDRYYIIDDENLAPHSFIFEWIKQCADERSVANIPEIKDMFEPDTGLQSFINIMLIANKLKIPHASFNKFMVKKMTPLARDFLIDLPTVSRIFDSGDSEMYELGLQEIAATSIFSHWYDYKLDAEEYDEYMSELADMRANIPELDDALHKAVADKDAWLKTKRQERREKQAAEEAGGDAGGFYGAGEGDTATAGDHSALGTGAGEDWAHDATATATDDWVSQVAATASTKEWEKTDGTIRNDTPSWAVDRPSTAASDDWASETSAAIDPIPSSTAGGGGGGDW